MDTYKGEPSAWCAAVAGTVTGSWQHHRVLAVVCPGQGSQTPAMLAPWLELPGVSELLATFSEASGVDLTAHGTTSDAPTIRNTAVAQPLIVAASLLSAQAIFGQRTPADLVDVTAGHSVGEFAAAGIAGVLSPTGAVALVSRRAQAMAQAAAAQPSGMSAIVGGSPEDVDAAIAAAAASTDGRLWPANINASAHTGRQQLVAGGSLEALAALADQPPARARVVPLDVAGAFHTPLMDQARQDFEPICRQWPADDPSLTLLSNLDGASYDSISSQPGVHGHGQGADVLARLAQQITAPVRWDLLSAQLEKLKVTGIIELAPGGVLSGLLKRSNKTVTNAAGQQMPVEIVTVKTPEDVDAARDLILTHSHAARVNRGQGLEGLMAQ